MKRTRREVLRDAAVASIAASLGRRAGAAEQPSPRKPNILLVLPDQHRHDAIGAAGDPAVATPTLDRLAREGTHFTSMWCQGPSCRPARASLITARYPYQHGIFGPDAPANDPAWPTVMKRLQSAGYLTATFGKTDYGFKDKSGSDVPEGDRGREGGPESASGRDVREMHPFIRSFGWDYASENPSQLDIAIPGYGSSYTDYLRAQ
ncbi:MAG TPA: sulfatase-like hydrolase/transferase, partial [Thermoanaerobaculia bacterium]|nr:sulfatase-like hydrolase/transferase [Thermoanaerobaculia bacterium]